MNEEQKQEMRRLRRLLNQMYKAAEHASLTDALADGAIEIVSRYNLILIRLSRLGMDTGGLFPPLPDDASLDRVGIASKLLSGYIDDEADEREGRSSGHKIVIGNMQGLNDLDQLKDIGRIVRENIAESFGQRPVSPPTPPTPSAPPEEAPTQPFPR